MTYNLTQEETDDIRDLVRLIVNFSPDYNRPMAELTEQQKGVVLDLAHKIQRFLS